jgi:hypothetical protein
MKKYVVITVLLSIIYSCGKPKMTYVKDKEYLKMSKITDEKLTRISVPHIIYLDTIDDSEVDISFTIKNIGRKDLNPILLKFHCGCITPPKYKSALKPNEEQKINMEFPIDKKGNFSYPIWVYGNFYPYTREIRVEGYRK